LRAVCLAALLLSLGTRTSAQIRGGGASDLESDYWIDVFYPKVFYSPKEGLAGGLFYQVLQPLRSEDFDSPPPYRVAFSFDGQLATSGSRFVKLEANAPGLWKGWRFSARLVARRRAKDNYFGLGNSSAFDPEVEDANPDFYRAVRTRYAARTELERTVVGPVRVLAGLHLERWKVAPRDEASALATDLANGVDPTIGVPTNDISFRFGLILDTRNDEVGPTRGVMLETILGAADADVAGDLTYTRLTVSARGFVPVTPLLQLAGRVVAQTMGGTPRLGSYYLIEDRDRFYTGLGGSASHRGLRENRLLGRDKLFGNLEARYTIAAFPTVYRISVIGFLDAGRVFQQEDFRITTDGLKVGGGTGVFIQVGRAGVVGFTVGRGPDGFVTDAHSRWTF
jgi:outer membrane protein assembly factor BamA